MDKRIKSWWCFCVTSCRLVPKPWLQQFLLKSNTFPTNPKSWIYRVQFMICSSSARLFPNNMGLNACINTRLKVFDNYMCWRVRLEQSKDRKNIFFLTISDKKKRINIHNYDLSKSQFQIQMKKLRLFIKRSFLLFSFKPLPHYLLNNKKKCGIFLGHIQSIPKTF